MDIIFPVCSEISAFTGQGSDCSIRIAFNQQIPLCSFEESSRNKDGSVKCRGWGELCTADPNFSFAFVDSKSEDGELVSLSQSAIYQSDIADSLLRASVQHIRLRRISPSTPAVRTSHHASPQTRRLRYRRIPGSSSVHRQLHSKVERRGIRIEGGYTGSDTEEYTLSTRPTWLR